MHSRDAFHWMKSFLLPSGIQESSAPGLVSIGFMRLPTSDRSESFPSRSIQFLGEPQGDGFTVITPEVSRVNLVSAESWESLLGQGEENTVHPSVFHWRFSPVNWIWWQDWGGDMDQAGSQTRYVQCPFQAMLHPFNPRVREMPQWVSPNVNLFIHPLFLDHLPSAKHYARCWGYSRKWDTVSATYSLHSDWPLCSSSQLSIKKCPTCKSDFPDDLFDHTLEQHMQTLSLNCPICDKAFPAKEKQIFEDHVFCHTL